MDLFSKACGATGPIRLHIEPPEGKPPQEVTRHAPFAVLGRHASADVVLEHPDLSRRHVYLQMIQGRVFYVLLPGVTGKLQGPMQLDGWLPDDDLLPVGPFGVRQLADDVGDDDLADLPLEPLRVPIFAEHGLPEVMLDCVEGSAQRRSPWRIRQLLTLIGKAPGCRIQLVSSTVSAIHCSLLRTPLGMWAIDLLGRGGIQINDVRLRAARLHVGDRLRVGRFVFQVLPVSSGRQLVALAPAAQAAQAAHAQLAVSAAPTERGEGHEQPNPDSGVIGVGGSLAPGQEQPVSEVLVAHQGHHVEGWLPVSGGERDPIVLELVQEFSQMQRQMLDQFQQMMVALVQSFGEMHRDQNSQIQDELRRLQQVSRGLANLPGSQEPSGSADLSQSTSADKSIEAHPRAGADAPKGGARSSSAPNRAAGRANANAGLSAKDANGTGVPPRQPSAGEATPQTSAPATAEDATGASAVEAGSTAPNEALNQGDVSREDVHAWLSQRILSIEDDHKGRLQRILSFFLGKQS